MRHGAIAAVRDADVALNDGEVAVLIGRNGSGKSSLLWALHGAGARTSGRVRVDGQDPADCEPSVARSLVGLVPQTPGDLLFADTVAAECASSDADAAAPAGTTRSLLDGIVAGIGPEIHPRDMSEGQRLALVLAIQLAASPRVLLLDEPTRGLDYPAKRRFAATVRRLAHNGHAVLVATHDAELAATIADRVLVMADGDLVADGSPEEILSTSTAFASQVARILGRGWLTVEQVRTALSARTPSASEAPA